MATFLVGKVLLRSLPEGLAWARIVETEAYPPGDPASHAYRRETARNRSMFAEHGRAYVYLAYGTAFMLNVSSEGAGVGAAVLIRAVAPEGGTALMAARRGDVIARDLARGPGRLTQALGIDRELDGIRLCASPERRIDPLFLGQDDCPVGEIGVSPRIGITKGVDLPLRFFLRGSRFLSGPTWLNA